MLTDVLVAYAVLLFAMSFGVFINTKIFNQKRDMRFANRYFNLMVAWSLIGANIASLWMHTGTYPLWATFAVLNFNYASYWCFRVFFRYVLLWFRWVGGRFRWNLWDNLWDIFLIVFVSAVLAAINVVGPFLIDVQFSLLSGIASMGGM